MIHRRVAAQAGVSPGSTTHHSLPGWDLLRETFRFYLQTASRLLAGDRPGDPGLDPGPSGTVRTFATEIIRREVEHPGEQLIGAEHEMLLYASTDSQLASEVRGWDAPWVGHIACDLEASGWPRPVETARLLMNLIGGYEL